MKFSPLFLLVFCLFGCAAAQSNMGVDQSTANYNAYVIPINKSTMQAMSLVSNPSALEHYLFKEEITENLDSNLLLINAGIYRRNGDPMGLFVSNATTYAPLNLGDGSGNFYLKPNGVFAITDDDAEIVESTNYKQNPKTLQAFQSGPMLVSQGLFNPQFNPNSANRNYRCGVGITSNANGKSLVLVRSRGPVTFTEFAAVFKNDFKCNDALCLESGNSVLSYPGIPAEEAQDTNLVSKYLVFNMNDANAGTHVSRKNVVTMIKGHSGIYEVPTEVNGVLKISFIFDSGASDVSISPDVALTLIRTHTITDEDFIGTQQYVFADGSTARSSVILLKEIKIQNLVLKKVKASISNSIDAPMLLGQSVLQRLGKYSVDNANHMLIIEN